MSQKCDKCSVVVYRKVYDTDKETGKIVGLGVDCGCRRLAAIQFGTRNPFAIEFDHVYDAAGGKLKVENLRQLSQAEKTYGFQSVVLNSDAQNFDDPVQQVPVDMAKIHHWKYSDQKRYRERFSR
jgi:hypothetical protein